eukprot:tig00001265_g7897.t1
MAQRDSKRAKIKEESPAGSGSQTGLSEVIDMSIAKQILKMDDPDVKEGWDDVPSDLEDPESYVDAMYEEAVRGAAEDSDDEGDAPKLRPGDNVSQFMENSKTNPYDEKNALGLFIKLDGDGKRQWIGPNGETMSRKQWKKLRKRLKGEQAMKEKKAARKKQVEERRLAREQRLKEELEAMTPEERQTYIEMKMAEVARLKAEKAAQKKELEARMQGGHRIVFDLEFEELMNERELKSLAQQIMYSYGVNVRSSKPFRIVLTSLKGQTLEQMCKVHGFLSWSLARHDAPYIEVFGKEELVYLTADSHNVIEELDPAKVYIVGGIVDHNRNPKLTFNKAVKQGIAHARLPLERHVQLQTTKVLLLQEVFTILKEFDCTGDWAGAIMKALPERKTEGIEGGSSSKQLQ